MKKIIYIACSLFLVAVSTVSCERDISNLNVNPKAPEVVPSVNLVGTAQQNMADLWVTPSVNFNISRFFTQQWTETQYVDETNYNFVTRGQAQSHYNRVMRQVLQPLKQASIFLDTESESTNYSTNEQAQIKKNKKAVIEIFSIFAWLNLVDTFGNVPYSEALNPEEHLQPKYDDAATIYADLQTRLANVMATIDTSLPSYNDLVYGGDMEQWIKFANTTKLIMGLNLADVDGTTAKSLVESAVADGVIADKADSYLHPFAVGTFSNPIYQNLVESGRDDFLPSDVLVDHMLSTNDPRISKYMTEGPEGGYIGGPYGSLATFANYSHIASTITDPVYPGIIYDPVYIKFMLAEAAARGFNVGDSAANLYIEAVKASMGEWGVEASDINIYLSAHPYNPADWKKSIGMEAWIAMYNRGFEAWYFFRRLDYPELEIPNVADGLVYRMPYSLNEYSTNAANVNAAASAIGGDTYTTKLFWDKN